MKIVQKKISLEQFKSRMNGIIPAYFKNGKGDDNVYSFNGKAKFDNGKRIPYTNYNLVPMSIKWQFGRDKNNDVKTYKGSCLSYNTIVSWFHFLEFYINLLSKHGCLNNNYENAEEYFIYEKNVYSEEECKAFDEKIDIICGNIKETKFETAKHVYDEMIKKYFPIFEIPSDYQDEWNKKYLSINEVHYWIEWSKQFEGVKSENDCKNNENCCDCEKYFKLHLNEMIESLKNFLQDLTEVTNETCNKCFIKIPLQLTVNIDDLGEYSIFCEDWEGGVRYNEYDVIRYDDKDWVFKGQDDELGSLFNQEFYEYYFPNEKYVRRITQNENNKTLVSGYTESKLSSFVSSTDIAYDNLGNRLPGILSGNTISEGITLGIPYKPKTAVRLTKIGDNEYWGDYLHSFEINDVDGVKKCIFTYFMGCTIPDKNSEEEPTDGVKYVDETILVKKQCKYYLDDFTFYTLNYYEIEHEKINYKDSGNNYNSYVDKAKFSVLVDNDVVNGFTNFPLVREEYMIGSSSMQNIENDIYINRGTARSFDYHLKLMEVNSLESLEQYGNGFFKIINN